jgi:hypothetical protein
VDNIKMDLGEIGWVDRDFIELAQDRDQWRALVNTVMNLHVQQKAGNLLTSLEIVSSRAGCSVDLVGCASKRDNLWFNSVGKAHMTDDKLSVVFEVLEARNRRGADKSLSL